MARITTLAACRRLGITHVTFKRWATLLEIRVYDHPHDGRFRLVEEEDVERIRAARADVPLSASETVRRPYVPLDPLPSIPATPRPVQRVVASSSAGHHSAGHHDPLPDGWVAWIRFSEELGIPGTTARRYLHDRVIPFEQGAWDSGVANRPYEYALTPEQQEEARRIIRELRGQ